MTQALGTLFPTLISSSGDTADIVAAFQAYHWGQTGSELPGSSMLSSGGGITGALYRLTNNPKFYGNGTGTYLTVYPGSTGTPGTAVFTINGSTNTLTGALTITGALTVTSQINATGAGLQGNIYSAGVSTLALDAGTSGSGGILYGNVRASSETTGKVTNSSTSTSAPGTYTQVGRIFVQSTNPNAAIAQTGDLWFW